MKKFIKWVDVILFQEWDPIGIKHVPQCVDEYSSYAPQIAKLVAQNAAPEIIAEHLNEIAEKRMGLKPDVENAYRVAQMLLAPKLFESE
jgi:hypothetical protein